MGRIARGGTRRSPEHEEEGRKVPPEVGAGKGTIRSQCLSRCC